MSEQTPDVEASQMIGRLIETIRQMDRTSLDALQYSERRAGLKTEMDSLWAQAGDIGAQLMRLGGLALAQRAVREVRRVSARMCGNLEDSWTARVPGYEKVKWLP